MDVGSLKKVIGADAWCFVSQKSHHNCALKTLICQDAKRFPSLMPPTQGHPMISSEFFRSRG